MFDTHYRKLHGTEDLAYHHQQVGRLLKSMELGCNCIQGFVTTCNLYGTEGGSKEKFSRNLGRGALEFHIAGWVNLACIDVH
jgi:hypothetical protein